MSLPLNSSLGFCEPSLLSREVAPKATLSQAILSLQWETKCLQTSASLRLSPPR